MPHDSRLEALEACQAYWERAVSDVLADILKVADQGQIGKPMEFSERLLACQAALAETLKMTHEERGTPEGLAVSRKRADAKRAKGGEEDMA